MPGRWKNRLYYGDNLEILRQHVADESVDLVYLDPPFNSKATYNVLFAEKNGSRSAAQITAFGDTWHWGREAEETYHELVTQGPKRVADLIQALRSFLGANDMMAYLTMMAIRLVELRRVLKSTGSIYLHCDPTASHYLKLLLDGVFGAANFKNEIVWKRTSAHSDAKASGRAHDVILFFCRTPNQSVWNKQFQAYDREYIDSHYRYKDESGRLYRTDNLTATGLSGGGYEYEWNGITRVWRCPIEKMREMDRQRRIKYTRKGTAEYVRYLDEMPGVPLQDVWTDIAPINSQAKERLGYPTQKPEALLERIIQASSNEGDLVLDPFCGCGTTIAVAERLNRRWIGIDVTHLAIALMRHRLHDAFHTELALYEVVGEPKDLAGARALARENRFQFEWWALGLVDARPAQDKRRGPDKGIDGYIYFFDDPSGRAKQLIVQVKSGQVSVKDTRDLKGVLEREKAQLGAFLTLEAPTRQMLTEAYEAGFYEPEYLPQAKFQRLQILTIKDLFAGRRLDYPRYAVSTFKQAERKSKQKPNPQSHLF